MSLRKRKPKNKPAANQVATRVNHRLTVDDELVCGDRVPPPGLLDASGAVVRHVYADVRPTRVPHQDTQQILTISPESAQTVSPKATGQPGYPAKTAAEDDGQDAGQANQESKETDG
jgi:hypothetical protein